MGILSELRDLRGLYVRCPDPECGEEFPISDARLFDATRRLPTYAVSYLTEQRADLQRDRLDLKAEQEDVLQESQIKARATRFGQWVEQVAPSLAGFPVAAADCRPLFKPIDYLVFNGLAARGRVESLLFVDVKSGRQGLRGGQRDLRDLVEEGRVSLVVQELTHGHGP